MSEDKIAELTHENRDSVAVKRNAKGEYAWDIKIYYDAGGNDAKDVVKYLKFVDDKLKENFM